MNDIEKLCREQPAVADSVIQMLQSAINFRKRMNMVLGLMPAPVSQPRRTVLRLVHSQDL
jgi:hypothetical protein